MRRRTVLITLTISIAASACGPSLVMKRPDTLVVPSRLVAIPPSLQSFEVDADGVLRDLDDETFTATKYVVESINYAVSTHGGRYFSASGMTSVDGVAEFRVWSALTLAQILGELNGSLQRRHKQVDEFRFTGDVSVMKDKLKTDFVLISGFLDGQNTGGRAVSNLLAMGFGGRVIEARQQGLACIVQLRDGHVVWCNLIGLARFNIRGRQGAQDAIGQILGDVLGPGPDVKQQ